MMTLDFEIRRAVLDDAEGIARVNNAVWAGDDLQPALVVKSLQIAWHVGHVALVDNMIVGFVDSFLTPTQEGDLRCEVNLIAVLAEYRGQGIARALVSDTNEAGRDLGASSARAWIKVDNVASQRTFAKSGYQVNEEPCDLYVAAGDIPAEFLDWDNLMPRRTHVIPVVTFQYEGLWLEGEFLPETFTAAQAMRVNKDGMIAGAVIPISQQNAIQAAVDAGYALIGRYQWWHIAFV